VLLAGVDWLDDTLLDSQRSWLGEWPRGRRLTWKSIPKRARELGIRVRGHFAGEPGLPDAQAVRRAIAFVRFLINELDAIVLIRDTDDQKERRLGLEQARTTDTSGSPIVLGVAIPERESWVISGFEPKNDKEAEWLKSETRRLGWNPCIRSQDLSAAKDDTALRSPKRVLAVLTESDWKRQRDCWLSTDLDTLETRGRKNGLEKYLKEVRFHLLPLITGYESPSR